MTWEFEDDGSTAWDEIDDSNWSTRHIEATGPEHRYTAVASLAEVNAARNTAGIDGVRAYERTYGFVPEVAFPEEVLAELSTVSAREFAQRWIAARQALKAATR